METGNISTLATIPHWQHYVRRCGAMSVASVPSRTAASRRARRWSFQLRPSGKRRPRRFISGKQPRQPRTTQFPSRANPPANRSLALRATTKSGRVEAGCCATLMRRAAPWPETSSRHVRSVASRLSSPPLAPDTNAASAAHEPARTNSQFRTRHQALGTNSRSPIPNSDLQTSNLPIT